MGGRSRRKGKVGERELAAILRLFGFDARRGQQHRGGPDSPDVIVKELPWLHFECKRRERLGIYSAVEQPEREVGEGRVPVVAYRANHRRWLAILGLEDFLVIVKELHL